MLTGKGPVRSDDHIIFLQILRSHELGDRAMVNTARQCAWSTVVLLSLVVKDRHAVRTSSLTSICLTQFETTDTGQTKLLELNVFITQRIVAYL